MAIRDVRRLYRGLILAGLLAGLAAGLGACAGEEQEGRVTPTATPTRTPAGTPRATVTPTPSPTATATPTQVAFPPGVHSFADYATVIAAYLTEEQGSPSCLAELFATWDMPDGEVGPRCARGDLDGDGEDEYLVRITFLSPRGRGGRPPSYDYPTGEPIAGDILLLDSHAGRYEPAYGLIYESIVWGHELAPVSFPFDPTILGVEDYNGDGRAEAAFTHYDCGAHTCSTGVIMLGWDGSDYVNLFAEPVSAPWTSPSDIEFIDLDGDGVKEVRVPAGQIASVGAGPQRDRVEFYAWDGTNYVLAKTEHEPSDFLYFAVTDADAAYTAGDVETAVALYRRAIDDSSLVDWYELLGGPEPRRRDRDELVPYAQFRLYLAQLSTLAADETVRAQELLDSISELVNDYPDSMHALAALQFATAYPDGEVSASALATGCVAFLAFVEENREQFDELWNYGYANPDLAPEGLCPH